MKSTCLDRAVPLLLILPMALTGQLSRERDAVPLKHWSAPPYWQPTKAENQAATAAQPNAVIDANAASSTNALAFVGITPCRVVDTRNSQGFTGAFGPPSLAQNSSRTFPIQSSVTCAIPSSAQAYSFNFTVVPPGPLGFITAYPTGQPLPLAATLNSLQGFIVGNAAIIAAGTAGSVDVYASDPTDLIIDVNGYYIPQTQAGLTLAQGTAGAPTLSFTGDPGTGIFSSGTGILNLAAGGKSAVTLNSTGDVTVAGGIHASGAISSGNSVTLQGKTNSITVDSIPPIAGFPTATIAGLPYEIYFGADNGTTSPTFDQVKVGIGTRAITGGSKLTVFDPSFPALDITTGSGNAKGQLAIATCIGCYSAVATPGDVVLRADSGSTEDLILATTNFNNGAIRFSTRLTPTEGGVDSEKMTLLSNGNLGVGSKKPPTAFAVGDWSNPTHVSAPPFQVDKSGDMVRIKKLLYSWPSIQGAANTTTVLTNDGSGGLSWGLGGGGGGGLSGNCTTNYLTKWLSTTGTVGCSEITDTGTNVLVDSGSQIPTTSKGPTYLAAKMEIKDNPTNLVGVNGLRLTNVGISATTSVFAEAGVVFSPGINGFPYDAGRIYAKFNSQNAPHGGRLTLQSVQGGIVNSPMVDTLTVFNGNVGIGTTNPNPTVLGTGKLHAAGNTVRPVDALRTVASSSEACNIGEIAFDAAYVYTCVAPNTWRRAATSSPW